MILLTAIAFCYTKYGFVIGADGRSRTLDSATGEFLPNGENHQKVFRLVGSGKVLAYSVMGDAVANDDNSFDVMTEIERHHKRLATKQFANLRDYLGAISVKLRRAYEKAMQSGRLDYKPRPDARDEYDRLLARVITVGYVAAKPSCVEAEFFCEDKGQVESRVRNVSIKPGVPALAVPAGIHAVVDNDPRFAEYRLPFGPDISIEDAHAMLRRRIEACASPLAAEIEPLCAGIGGHIHIAAISPSRFSWLEPPLSL